ncbi:hypothetical protein EPUL_006003, partial [Erysiphe pulchra]
MTRDMQNLQNTKRLPFVINAASISFLLPELEVDDYQPPVIKVERSEEYEINHILDLKRALGNGRRMKYL